MFKKLIESSLSASGFGDVIINDDSNEIIVEMENIYICFYKSATLNSTIRYNVYRSHDKLLILYNLPVDYPSDINEITSVCNNFIDLDKVLSE